MERGPSVDSALDREQEHLDLAIQHQVLVSDLDKSVSYNRAFLFPSSTKIVFETD